MFPSRGIFLNTTSYKIINGKIKNKTNRCAITGSLNATKDPIKKRAIITIKIYNEKHTIHNFQNPFFQNPIFRLVGTSPDQREHCDNFC